LFFEKQSGVDGHRSTLGHLLRTKRIESGLSGHELTELTGEYGNVNHGGAVSNWEIGRNVPSREQYEKICNAILATGKVKSMPKFEEVVRPFNMRGDLEYTDVWNFPSVRPYRGKHPAEKPLSMLTHIISASSYEGDVVLDCFAGSGATGVAAIQMNRKAILIDIEEQWAKRSTQRLSDAVVTSPENTVVSLAGRKPKAKRVVNESLFD
jgi:site-specific DNA-methyltransferase (adenine-specific)